MIFTIFDWLSAVFYSEESIFPVLFTTESCDSPHHFGGESPFVSIICINYRLSFNTPRIDYYGESLLPASFTTGSHCWQRRVIFENFEGLHLPIKGQWSKKWKSLEITAHQEQFKIVKNMGYLRLCFWLLAVIDSGEKISKLLWGMSIETRISRLVKKTGVKKSRWTVPLSTNISTKIRKIPKLLLGMSIETGISRLMEKNWESKNLVGLSLYCTLKSQGPNVTHIYSNIV